MAYNNRYQYETSPRKLQPEYEPIKQKYPKKSTIKNNKNSSKKQKKEKAKHNKATLYVIIGFLLLFTMSYRNALISQNYSNVKTLESSLATIEKENEQLEVNIETSLNLQNIEKSATEMLGMQKVSNTQTVYVNLPREDYVEPATEEIETTKEDSWLTEIWNMILDYIK
jgi:hypothetical protein